MSKLRLDISTSLDGFVAGPNQSVEQPLGEGGEELHEWVVGLEVWRRRHGMEGGEVNASTSVLEESLENVGATIMGRNMFGGGPGPWGDDPWDGWWGDDPPFHMPVFVVTHHARPPLEKAGGTTFTFVTDGIESALAQARAAAGAADIAIAGGADVAQQYLAAGLVDEVQIHVAPVLLGAGARLFDNLGGALPALEQVRAVAAPGVTHVKYRVVRGT
ncbi:MAG: dihydrofolate reductase family protein [Actinomycetota bacterium]|nr:dihydrofolate reductase family protein [Actinomycetota bacterium]